MSKGKKITLADALRKVRKTYYSRIIAELKNTKHTYREIAQTCGVSENCVYTICRLHGLTRSLTASTADISEGEAQ